MPLRPLSAHRAVLALGSNLGESESTIERAVVDLRGGGVRVAGWLDQGGAWYYLMPETGLMATGWTMISGRWYYFASSGAWV